MKVKVIKLTSLAVAVFTVALTLYTLCIGFRLAVCSWVVTDARENFSIGISNEVYHDTNVYRKEIASESGFSNMVCHMSNIMRGLLLTFECAVFLVSYVLFEFIRECERRIAIRERRMTVRRQQMSRR